MGELLYTGSTDMTGSVKPWGSSISFMPRHELKGMSNINAHHILLQTQNLIRGELLNVFSNNAVRATDTDPA